jgi:hypothetical protein
MSNLSFTSKKGLPVFYLCIEVRINLAICFPTHTKLAPVINKEEHQKPVFIYRPNNIEIRIKDEHRYSFQSENNWQPIRIHYFNFCQDRRVHRISNFKFVFHRLLGRRLSRIFSLLGLPSSASAHDILLVTLLTTMPIRISSVSSIVSRILAPGNSLREPKANSTVCMHLW